MISTVQTILLVDIYCYILSAIIMLHSLSHFRVESREGAARCPPRMKYMPLYKTLPAVSNLHRRKQTGFLAEKPRADQYRWKGDWHSSYRSRPRPATTNPAADPARREPAAFGVADGEALVLVLPAVTAAAEPEALVAIGVALALRALVAAPAAMED